MDKQITYSGELPILKYRGYIAILDYGKNDHRIYGSVAKEDESEKPWERCIAGNNLKEVEEQLQSFVNRMIRIREYNQKNQNWKHSVDSKSISAVYNILPEVLLERINNGDFDEDLLEGVVGSDYEVPLYYVTKAWDYTLNGCLCGKAYQIDIGEENPTEEDISEFIAEYNPTRFRKDAIALNNSMKEIWQDKFGINIDNLEVDFSKFNKHLHPQVAIEDEYYFFGDVPDGVDEWILTPVIYPDINYIFFDAVSCLMEFSARIARDRQSNNWAPWE